MYAATPAPRTGPRACTAPAAAGRLSTAARAERRSCRRSAAASTPAPTRATTTPAAKRTSTNRAERVSRSTEPGSVKLDKHRLQVGGQGGVEREPLVRGRVVER